MLSQIIDFYHFLVTNILTKDKKIIHLTSLYVHRRVRGALNHPISNIKIEENPKLFAIYAILENKIITIQVFVHYIMQKE